MAKLNQILVRLRESTEKNIPHDRFLMWVISRIVPIDLMVEERTGTIGMTEVQKRSARKNTIAKWQNRWQNSEKDIWLHRLLPDITVWYYRTHGEVDSWLTQVMTSHGRFQAYLKRISKSDDDTCIYCHEEPDDACHTLFRCNKWREQRERMEATLGQELRPRNLIHNMIEDAHKWRTVETVVKEIMHTKEEDEIRRDRERLN
ncbi:hypothetical protein NQ314_014694 [Rhamnusium bicolor]|uniref:Reverse transcriptase zinc-binding domain-containing protein n=1 Tax=Rhamnusium bicolor TaxID=1586634 RepID=A0AAV8X137_9CUCU|nr:hypothetical protein NQ314_014694 [Rhamnusium bicolor]